MRWISACAPEGINILAKRRRRQTAVRAAIPVPRGSHAAVVADGSGRRLHAGQSRQPGRGCPGRTARLSAVSAAAARPPATTQLHRVGAALLKIRVDRSRIDYRRRVLP
jgi:hypothetical protein